MSRSRGTSLLYAAPFLVAALWLFLPVITGDETLFLRDAFNTHLPMKWFQAGSMAAGELPLVDTYRSGGQPHLGNPNTVPLYPDNVLYLLAGPVWAFNAHFWLHFLLAPLSMLYLARQIGVGRLAGWSAGVLYATGGYYLSTLNLYNLSASATLTPAFLGACMVLARDPGRRRAGLPLAAVLWALLVLGGDPMTAVVALAAGAVTAVLAAERRPAKGVVVGRLAVAVLLGTLVAAPQVVEFLRIVPASYRGVQGYSVEAATAASWSPVNLLDWVLPMPFGEPDLLYWGERFHAGRRPLLHSVYPGLLALALALVGSRRGRAWVGWSWGLVGVGVFFAMGSYNPVAAWLLGLPGMQIFRLPVKLWVLTACGLAVLAGLGIERLLEGGADRSLRRVLTGLLALVVLGVLLLGPGREAAVEMVRGWMPPRIPPEHAAAEVGRWLRWCLGSCALLVAALLVVGWTARTPGRRRRVVAGALLLALHLAGQLVLLGALVPTEPVEVLLERSPLLEDIPAEARVVHGDAGSLFGPATFDPAGYPDSDVAWLQRDTLAQLYPPAGILAGRRYEFWPSPEGLDSFLTRAATQALPLLDDPGRLAMLEASGVTHLLLTRDLEGIPETRARLVRRAPAGTADLRLYELERGAAEVEFVGRILYTDDPRRALLQLTDPTFDPRSSAVLDGAGAPSLGGQGSLEVLAASREEIAVRLHVERAGAVVFQRSFLPIYSAELDGRPAPIELANLHRMAVEVPPGEHRLRLFVERGSLLPALVVSALGLLLLALRARPRGRRGAPPATA